MNTAFDFVCLKSKINISVATMVNVVLENSWPIKVKKKALTMVAHVYAKHIYIYLVKNTIKTLIQSFQVEQNHCSTNLHTNLDLVDILTHLYIRCV